MFIELEKKRIEFSFGKGVIWFRFDNKAFLNIEKKGLSPFDTRVLYENSAAARAFIREGLQNCLKELGITEKETELINSLMMGNKEELIHTIQLAVLEALPADTLSKEVKQGGGGGNAGTLLSVYCDIMGRSEEEFWNATLREVTERWDNYSILKGYKQAPLQVQRFDD